MFSTAEPLILCESSAAANKLKRSPNFLLGGRFAVVIKLFCVNAETIKE